MPIYSYKTKKGKLWYIKLNINGHQYVYRGFNSKKAAIIYEASLLKDEHKLVNGNYEVSELIPLFCSLIEDKVKITTAHWKIGVYKRHIFKYFDCKVQDITSMNLEIIAKSINARENFKDRKRLFAMVKEFLYFLMDYGLSRNINMSMLYVPYQSTVVETNFDYYTREEFNQFISVIDNPKYKLIFTLLFDYGLRIGECLGLRHKDITNDRVFIRGSITAKAGKGKQMYVKPKTKSSVRDYPMLTPIKQAYLDYLKTISNYDRNDFVFKATKNNMTIGESQIRREQKKYEELSKLRHIKLHEFRHSCATELINKGFSPEQVAAWLGHSSSEVTLKTYFHLFPSRKMEIANFYNKT